MRASVVVGRAGELGVLDRLARDFFVAWALSASVTIAALDLVALGAGLAEPQGAAGDVQGDPDHRRHDGDDHEQENCNSASHALGLPERRRASNAWPVRASAAPAATAARPRR